MCNNCNCEAYDKCSIVGYMPIGFCCTKCDLYDEQRTCLNSRIKSSVEEGKKIEPIETSIKDGILKVVIKKEGKKVPLVIDLQKQLGSE
ncbi:MAG: hypothetical protein ACFFDO_10200 [Candidatus Thorarchaeota archaeon]